MNDRDEHGWRIPREGTRSRAIYARMCGGFTAAEIHAEIGGSRNAIEVLMWKIKNPERANALACHDSDRPVGRPRGGKWSLDDPPRAPITLPQLNCLRESV